MGKASVGLSAGYWPENAFRYVDVPFWGLDVEVLEEPSKKWGDQPALSYKGLTVTYNQLRENTDKIAGALQAKVGPATRIVLCFESPINLITAFFGALETGHAAYLMDPRVPPSKRARELFAGNQFFCEQSLVARAPELSSGMPVVVYEELLSAGATKQFVNVDTEAASIFPSGTEDAQAAQSHHSLLASAFSWGAFFPFETGKEVLCCRPVQTWDGLDWVLASLVKGSICLFGDLDDPELPAALQQNKPQYAILDNQGLEKIAGNSNLAKAVRETLAGVVVQVEGIFSPEWRRKARNRIGTEVLTLYGTPRLGAVLATHPSWVVDPSIGIPVSNVDIWPLDPKSRDALDVTFDAIEYAEIGAKSPMVAPAVLGSGDKWVPTGLVATMDANGFFYFLEAPSQWINRIGLGVPLLDSLVEWFQRRRRNRPSKPGKKGDDTPKTPSI